MPEPAEQSAERRRAVDTLRIASSIAAYAAGQISADGLGPEEARQATADAAGELVRAADMLRRLARPDDSAQRHAVALELAAAGWPPQEIAERLGVTAETARRYLRRAKA